MHRIRSLRRPGGPGQAVPGRALKKLSFKLPTHQFAKQNTYAQLHTRAAEVARFVESGVGPCATAKRSDVLFPFMTTLGVSGGVFLLACYITRLAPSMF